ncbi:diaminopimelate epimerase [Thermomonas sp.]|uniref:diaminopimelate epimerase n=1 Tax=Thermomonas sp. TaxID=1971895 RepID=UPI0035B48317
MPLHFTKMHGAGNDFVVLDLRDGQSPPDPATCARIADRHRGVGCDQLLTVESPREAGSIASYRIWNADGSPSGQCGNGARCIAAWLVRDGAAPGQGEFTIDSPSRTHCVAAHGDGGFTVEMGAPRFEPAEIPLAGFAHMQDDYVVQLANGERIEHLRFGAVSMGNPHAVVEVSDVDAADVARIGPALQRHAAFPASANVGFAQVLSPGHIRLRVYERGVGETLACGSGACAAVAVLAARGRVDGDREVIVDLPGGRLRIRQDRQAGTMSMGGPAAFVFEGTMQQGSGA